MQTATDTKTGGPMGMSYINLIYSDGSSRDLFDFSATYGYKTEF
jgi:hypothetical protein